MLTEHLTEAERQYYYMGQCRQWVEEPVSYTHLQRQYVYSSFEYDIDADCDFSGCSDLYSADGDNPRRDSCLLYTSGDWLQNHQMVPEKLSADIPILFALGQKELKIQNYKKILQYSPKEMILLLKSKRLVIQGDHLDIYYFNADEVCIRGHIVSIIYQSG